MTPHCRFSSLLLLLGLLAACESPKPANTAVPLQLVAKYRVLDERLSPQHTKCAQKVKSFLAADAHDCSFTVRGAGIRY
ncbi:hypothetical protein [Hymenobacter jeollabukensis]|uniref:Lipoprotein n=1 Tax=Hymenobacter jeollabukensis TaxID=2025313 RepID=A0A5R8WM16_9BACT|nr:hypothetical protein [Hymenobacter jeollabukensis]TLM90106.1 hypothetical protein FDY95_19005 [Hymenobacter jeollabukensis]